MLPMYFPTDRFLGDDSPVGHVVVQQMGTGCSTGLEEDNVESENKETHTTAAAQSNSDPYHPAATSQYSKPAHASCTVSAATGQGKTTCTEGNTFALTTDPPADSNGTIGVQGSDPLVTASPSTAMNVATATETDVQILSVALTDTLSTCPVWNKSISHGEAQKETTPASKKRSSQKQLKDSPTRICVADPAPPRLTNSSLGQHSEHSICWDLVTKLLRH
jgi:hypothetical protein